MSHPPEQDGWWPVATVAEVEAALPSPLPVVAAGRSWAVTLLDGVLAAFPDQCPHRRVPLSRGTVVADADGDRIECAYHGWRFAAGGRCTAIPALGPGAPVPPGMRVSTAGQVCSRDGLVWLAPDPVLA